MADMPGDDAPHLATAGRRLRIKILLALVLASGVPILVLAYVVLVAAVAVLAVWRVARLR